MAIYHRGMAEVFGVSLSEMENMTLREMAERAFGLGGYIEVIPDSGVGVGLTLSARESTDRSKESLEYPSCQHHNQRHNS